MATIPQLPQMAAGQMANAAALNEIGAACTFLLNRPIARIHDATGALSLSTTAKTITYTTKDFDNDGMWSVTHPERLTVQTAGWYKARYGVQIALGGGSTANSFVQSVTGPNNPVGPGVVSLAALSGYAANSPTATPGAAGLFPSYLYAGDYLYVQVFVNSGSTATSGASASFPLSFFSLELVSI